MHRTHPISRILFWLTCALAGMLAAMVLLAPLCDNSDPIDSTTIESLSWANRLVHLFAKDIVVRRVSLASAVGLIVTACVFFQPPGRRFRDIDDDDYPTRPRSSGIAGA